MTKPNPNRDAIIEAIRDDRIVGRYTCSVIDECYSDDELIDEFGFTENGRPRTPKGALREARYRHELWAERFNEIASTAF